MKYLFVLLLIFLAVDLIAQKNGKDKQEEKMNYYASLNDNYKTIAQKDKYNKIADITGNISLIFTVVSVFSFSEVSQGVGADPKPIFLVSALVGGMVACVFGSTALIYDRKAKNIYNNRNHTSNMTKQKYKWTIGVAENGMGLTCSF